MFKVFSEIVLSTMCSLVASYSIPMMVPHEEDSCIFVLSDVCTDTVKADSIYTAEKHGNYSSINCLATGWQMFLSPAYFSLN